MLTVASLIRSTIEFNPWLMRGSFAGSVLTDATVDTAPLADGDCATVEAPAAPGAVLWSAGEAVKCEATSTSPAASIAPTKPADKALAR